MRNNQKRHDIAFPVSDRPLSIARKGLTLVELLAVVVIITILASITFVAMSGSMQTAKEMKTLATIEKLDAAIQPIFESYGDRFNAILDNSNYSGSLTGDDLAKVKLHLIHDLMRMEMPQSWGEICNFNDGDKKLGPIEYSGSPKCKVNEPAALQYYYDAMKKAGTSPLPNRACLLFLVIANLNPEALEAFQGSEIAVDSTGLMYFADAWGNPIHYLRSAPGFTGTDKQYDVVARSGITLGLNSTSDWGTGPNQSPGSSFTTAFRDARNNWPDPFDTRSDPLGWFLYPLIYSAGPDGIGDIYSFEGSGSSNTPVSPNAAKLDPLYHPFGMPIDDDNNNVLNHYDNIHNHRHSGGF